MKEYEEECAENPLTDEEEKVLNDQSPVYKGPVGDAREVMVGKLARTIWIHRGGKISSDEEMRDDWYQAERQLEEMNSLFRKKFNE